MPKPKAGESKEDYVSRCIGTVMDEGGSTQEQAAGKCYGMWESAKKSEFVEKYYNEINNYVLKAKTVRGYESPEPGDLSEAKADQLAEVYATCREGGGNKESCSKQAWAAVKKSDLQDRVQKAIREVTKIIDKIEMADLLKMYEPELDDLVVKAKEQGYDLVGDQLNFMKEIYARCRQDGNEIDKSQAVAMTFVNREGKKLEGDIKGIVKSIQSIVESIADRQIEKAEVGDKKTIFGKPFEWSGSKWEPSEVGSPRTEVTDQDLNDMKDALSEAGYDMSQHDINDPEDKEAIIQMHQREMGVEEDGEDVEGMAAQAEFTDQMQDEVISYLKDQGYSDTDIEEMNEDDLAEVYDEMQMEEGVEETQVEDISRDELESQAMDAFVNDPDFTDQIRELAGESASDEEIANTVQDMMEGMSDDELKEQIDISREKSPYTNVQEETDRAFEERQKKIPPSPSPDEPGGWVEASDLKRDDFSDPKTYDYLNSLPPNELEKMFENAGLDPSGDIMENFNFFKDQELQIVRGFNTKEDDEDDEDDGDDGDDEKINNIADSIHDSISGYIEDYPDADEEEIIELIKDEVFSKEGLDADDQDSLIEEMKETYLD